MEMGSFWGYYWHGFKACRQDTIIWKPSNGLKREKERERKKKEKEKGREKERKVAVS